MAVININGVIGDEYTFSKFLTDYAATGEEQIRLLINSPGGEVTAGEQIADFIKSHSDRFVSVSNSGDVASIAASIFLSLETEKRFFDLSKGLFLIHNPFIAPESLFFADTTADGLADMAGELATVENSMAKFIQSQTGADLEIIKALMKINEPLTEEQINNLNIATVAKFKAVAFINKNQTKMTQEQIEKMIEEKNESLLSKFMALFNKRTKFVALMVTDVDGKIIDFPDVPEGSIPEIGDSAKYDDGSAIADGDVKMATGETYTFAGGKLDKITEKVADPEPTPVDELVACPDCGAMNEPTAKFCSSCGAKMEAKAAAQIVALGTYNQKREVLENAVKEQAKSLETEDHYYWGCVLDFDETNVYYQLDDIAYQSTYTISEGVATIDFANQTQAVQTWTTVSSGVVAENETLKAKAQALEAQTIKLKAQIKSQMVEVNPHEKTEEERRSAFEEMKNKIYKN